MQRKWKETDKWQIKFRKRCKKRAKHVLDLGIFLVVGNSFDIPFCHAMIDRQPTHRSAPNDQPHPIVRDWMADALQSGWHAVFTGVSHTTRTEQRTRVTHMARLIRKRRWTLLIRDHTFAESLPVKPPLLHLKRSNGPISSGCSHHGCATWSSITPEYHGCVVCGPTCHKVEWFSRVLRADENVSERVDEDTTTHCLVSETRGHACPPDHSDRVKVRQAQKETFACQFSS